MTLLHLLELWDIGLVRWLVLLGVPWLLWCGFVWRYQNSFIFPVAGGAEDDPAAVIWRRPLPGDRPVEAALYAEIQGPAQPAVIYFHGNGEAIDDQDWYVAGYRSLGLAVLLVEYRGYGDSGGRPSQKGLVADAVWFRDQLAAQPFIDRERIVYHGFSLGGGVAAALADQRPPRALILQSTFTSISSFFGKLLVPPFLCRHPFRSDRAVRRLEAPVLVLHGERDMVVSVEHGRRLGKLAQRATYVEVEAGHNDLPVSEGEASYWTTIQRFLSEAGVIAGTPGG